MKIPGTNYVGKFSLNYLNPCPNSLFYWIPNGIKLHHKMTINAKP